MDFLIIVQKTNVKLISQKKIQCIGIFREINFTFAFQDINFTNFNFLSISGFSEELKTGENFVSHLKSNEEILNLIELINRPSMF